MPTSIVQCIYYDGIVQLIKMKKTHLYKYITAYVNINSKHHELSDLFDILFDALVIAESKLYNFVSKLLLQDLGETAVNCFRWIGYLEVTSGVGWLFV